MEFILPALGAYAKEIVLARPDRRTKEGRCLAQARLGLIEHLGGEANLTNPQRALIERCAMLQLRCAVLDKKVLDGTFSEYDAKTYLAFSNSLRRSLESLGLGPAAVATPPMDAVEYGRLLNAQRADVA